MPSVCRREKYEASLNFYFFLRNLLLPGTEIFISKRMLFLSKKNITRIHLGILSLIFSRVWLEFHFGLSTILHFAATLSVAFVPLLGFPPSGRTIILKSEFHILYNTQHFSSFYCFKLHFSF